MTFHHRWDPSATDELPVTHTWRIDDAGDGVCKLTVITEGLVPGSTLEAEFADGIVYIVSGLKSYLETGEALAAAS